MYAGLGALTETTKSEVVSHLPKWWSKEWEECWIDGTNRTRADCLAVLKIEESLGPDDQEKLGDFVEASVPTLSEKQLYTYLALAVGAGLALGMIVGVSMAR